METDYGMSIPKGGCKTIKTKHYISYLLVVDQSMYLSLHCDAWSSYYQFKRLTIDEVLDELIVRILRVRRVYVPIFHDYLVAVVGAAGS